MHKIGEILVISKVRKGPVSWQEKHRNRAAWAQFFPSECYVYQASRFALLAFRSPHLSAPRGDPSLRNILWSSMRYAVSRL